MREGKVMQPDLFSMAESTQQVAPAETSGTLGDLCRVLNDTDPRYQGRVHVQYVSGWDKTWEHKKPVLIADLDPVLYNYMGFTQRSQVRGLTRVHRIKDNPIYPTIRHYLDQGYSVWVCISTAESAHPDTCAMYAFKERILPEAD